jgi:hypothetical protein
VVITGSSGEDYLVPYRNGFSLDTDSPDEVLQVLDWLHGNRTREKAMRAAAIETASRYCWDEVVDRLTLALELDAGRQLASRG